MRKPSTLLCSLALVAGATLAGQEPRLVVGPNTRVSGESGTPYVEQMLAVNPVDPANLVGVSLRVDSASTITVAVVSRDGGRTWHESPLPACGLDPWVAFRPSGEVLVSCLANGQPDPVLLLRSSDEGQTWQAPVALPLNGKSYDHPTMAVDTTSGSRSGTIYLIAAQSVPSPSGRASLVAPAVVRSTDGGRTLSVPIRVHATNLWANILSPVILPDGSLGFGFIDYAVDERSAGRGVVKLKAPRVWWVRSDDGGITFSMPYLVTEIEEMSRWGYVVADASNAPSSGHLYVVTDDFRDGGGGVFVFRSLDQGETWSRSTRVSRTDTARRVRRIPTAAVNHRGTLLVAWFDPQEDVGPTCWRLVASASVDGGTTFLPPVPVAEVASCNDRPGNVVPRAEESFDVAARWPAGGDYFGLVANPDGTFRALWSDSRTGVFQLWTASIDVLMREGSKRPK
jgi:hypothetical protein